MTSAILASASAPLQGCQCLSCIGCEMRNFPQRLGCSLMHPWSTTFRWACSPWGARLCHMLIRVGRQEGKVAVAGGSGLQSGEEGTCYVGRGTCVPDRDPIQARLAVSGMPCGALGLAGSGEARTSDSGACSEEESEFCSHWLAWVLRAARCLAIG